MPILPVFFCMKAFAQSIHNWLRGVEKKINKALIKREVKKHERAKMKEQNRWKILLLIFLAIVIISTSSVGYYSYKTNIRYDLDAPYDFEVYLYDNPFCNLSIESTVKDEVWDIENFPYILIEGEGMIRGYCLFKIEVYDTKGEVIFEGGKEVEVKQGEFTACFKLEDALKDPERAKISFCGNVFILPIIQHRLYGRVTDFEGNPRPNCFITAHDAEFNALATVKSDAEGYYELWLPEKDFLAIAAADESYSKETLECWVWDVRLNKDLELNLRYDKLEIYKLHGWFGQQVVFLDFSPMSLTLVKEAMESGASSENIWPKLSEGNVKVYVNDKEFEILTFTEHPEYLGQDTPARNGYLISIDKSEFLGVEDPVVKVIAAYPVKLDDETLIEKGEGIFLGFLKNTGV